MKEFASKKCGKLGKLLKETGGHGVQMKHKDSRAPNPSSIKVIKFHVNASYRSLFQYYLFFPSFLAIILVRKIIKLNMSVFGPGMNMNMNITCGVLIVVSWWRDSIIFSFYHFLPFKVWEKYVCSLNF